MPSWQSTLEYRPGNTYNTLMARSRARLYRLANVGGPTASERAYEILGALAVAKRELSQPRRSSSSASQKRGGGWLWRRRR